MSSNLLYNVIVLLAADAANIAEEKNRLAAVVSPENFEEINDCVLMVHAMSNVKIAKLYRFATSAAIEHGWTLKEYKEWSKRWQVT